MSKMQATNRKIHLDFHTPHWVKRVGHEYDPEALVSWNSYHYPVIARYIRTLPKPSGGMTTRFPKNWGYFGSLNNPVQLKFECATIMATLGDCCVGDQLTPSGKPEEGVYELIGEAFRFVKEREAWTSGAKSVGRRGERRARSGAGLVRQGEDRDRIRSAGGGLFPYRQPQRQAIGAEHVRSSGRSGRTDCGSGHPIAFDRDITDEPERARPLGASPHSIRRQAKHLEYGDRGAAGANRDPG
ncbi:hypothetical protein [Paenibacillus sp. GCM10012303]|uniref:hypothetical protein n=1 Tax=Paenibacillus sp. GCM10012303 TaxID=3317340 RepID=UPI003611B36C